MLPNPTRPFTDHSPLLSPHISLIISHSSYLNTPLNSSSITILKPTHFISSKSHKTLCISSTMQRIKGFRIGHKLVKVIGWGLHRRRKDSSYLRLNQPNYSAQAMSKLCGFARSLKKSAKDLCFRKSGSNYIRLGTKEKNKNTVPKGHLAVYVGEKEHDAHRVLVPVIYFNHPLFGDLLRETEKVYGFKYDGGIHVPCRISEFENVKTKINAAGGCGGDRFGSRWSRRLSL